MNLGYACINMTLGKEGIQAIAKKQLAKESKLTSKDSMDILHEFEQLMDEN
mgnify:CR=1 FL=1